MRGHRGALRGSYRRSDDCGVEVCWGATYALKTARRPTSARRGLSALLSLLVLAPGALLLARTFWAEEQRPAMDVLTVVAQAQAQPYRGRNATFAYPEGVELVARTYAEGDLRDEKLLLVDAAHPLPERFAAPNTVSVARHGRGVVPVRALGVQSGKDTIEALHRFFSFARQSGAEGLVVWQGTLSAAEQRERQLERIAQYALHMAVEDAAAKALGELEAPEACEYRLGCCVDIRLCSADGTPDGRPLRMTEQGRFLLTHAWQYGFARRFPTDDGNPDKHYRFRYVGMAHSSAMAELGLALDAYVELLHTQGVVTVYKNGVPRYVIVCQPILDGYATLWLPKGAAVQAGVDNTGYAVVACTLW